MKNISYISLGAIYRNSPEELSMIIRTALHSAVLDVGRECAASALKNSAADTTEIKLAA